MLEQPGAKGAGPIGSSERQPKPKAEHSPWAVRRLCSGRPQASAFCAAEGGLCPAPASRRDALASDREAANLAGHGRLTASFAFDFACPCLISLMRTSRAERVCGNLPLVSFASWICFGLRTGPSEFRWAQAWCAASTMLVLRLPPILIQAIDAQAKAATVSRSAAARMLIEAGLTRRPNV